MRPTSDVEVMKTDCKSCHQGSENAYLRWSGKTNDRIRKLTDDYGRAIKDNASDLAVMENAGRHFSTHTAQTGIPITVDVLQ